MSAAPAALKKYCKKIYDASKLTKAEIALILMVVYCIGALYFDINQKLLKKGFVDVLNKKNQSDLKKLVDNYRYKLNLN
jgi:hypothetical protein